MSKNSWIPSGDLDFVTKAEHFSRVIAHDPEVFEVQPQDVQILTTAVARFRQTLQAARFGSRSQANTVAKDQARLETEKIMQRLKDLISANDRIDLGSKAKLDIRQPKKGGRAIPCPQEPPRLRFVRALHEADGATPMHELTFHACDTNRTKPEGAVRLELFVDLIPPDEPIPVHPGANYGSRPWYLRSFTRSPIRLIPPMARVPMRVVYWGRWADSQGNVGPFSATAVGWIEGGSNCNLPGGVGMALGNLGGRKPVPILEDARPIGPESRNESYRIAIIEVQSQSMNPQNPDAALPAPPAHEPRQIEGPEKEAA